MRRLYTGAIRPDTMETDVVVVREPADGHQPVSARRVRVDGRPLPSDVERIRGNLQHWRREYGAAE